MQGNSLTAEYLKIRAGLKGEQALKAAVDWYSAPVLSGYKPSVLINLGKAETGCISGTNFLACLWEHYHKCIPEHFNHLPIRFHLFQGHNQNLQLFCYVPEGLTKILQNNEARTFLMDEGYPSLDSNSLFPILKQRILLGFPHEIGIFLGYPIADVKGFIKNKGKNYLLNGYWKVYSDVPQALDQFRRFNEAKKQMISKWRKAIAK